MIVKIVLKIALVASVRRQFIGMLVYIYIYIRNFLDWMGFDRKAKRRFLTDFSDKPGFWWNLAFATVLREP